MTTPTVTAARRNGNPVGERMELARYTVPVGERVVYGQRVNGVARFLLGDGVVLVHSSAVVEDCVCRSRDVLRVAVRADAARHKRPNRVELLSASVGQEER
jgi:hypothetical protein